MDGSKEANGLRCADPEDDWLGSEVLGWLGSNALGSEALAGKALAGVELVSEVLGSEALANKALTFVQGTHGSIQRHVVRLPYLG